LSETVSSDRLILLNIAIADKAEERIFSEKSDWSLLVGEQGGIRGERYVFANPPAQKSVRPAIGRNIDRATPQGNGVAGRGNRTK
jgi:hypothetical protein